MRRVLLLFLLLAGVLGGLVASPVASAAPAPAAGERWALIVGVDRFQGGTRPNYGAVNDAADVRQALIQNGWADDHIKVLTDGAATAAAIRGGLQWLVDHSSPNGLSVFHYSGHVKQVGSTEYLWPHDNAFIPDTELAGKLRQLKGQAWVDISGCEAAGFDEGISAPNRLFTASSRANEKSYEIPDMRQSVFTLLLVEQGLVNGAGDANGDRRVSVQEAFGYAAQRAPQFTAGQAQGPQHPVVAGWDGTPLYL
ncbi:MAG TPA: caspase family protein, partial [Acidimicrobiales bacterium]